MGLLSKQCLVVYAISVLHKAKLKWLSGKYRGPKKVQKYMLEGQTTLVGGPDLAGGLPIENLWYHAI